MWMHPCNMHHTDTCVHSSSWIRTPDSQPIPSTPYNKHRRWRIFANTRGTTHWSDRIDWCVSLCTVQRLNFIQVWHQRSKPTHNTELMYTLFCATIYFSATPWENSLATSPITELYLPIIQIQTAWFDYLLSNTALLKSGQIWTIDLIILLCSVIWCSAVSNHMRYCLNGHLFLLIPWSILQVMGWEAENVYW